MTQVQALRRIAAGEVTFPVSAEQGAARQAVLVASLKLFAERGYAGASMRDIATAVGVKPASIYSHYASKEQILLELLRVGHQEHFSSASAAVAAAASTPEDRMAAFVRAHVLVHTDYPMLTTVVNTELHSLSAEAAGPILEIRSRSEGLLSDIIDEGVQAGVFDVPHAWLAAAAIGGMGLRVASWYSPEFELSPQAIADIYVEYAFRVLGFATKEK